jgi:DNA adenine methylase
MKIPNPVLKYYGSKFRLAEWIITHFPKHRHYVEPFGGAANVLLMKEPSKLETYNDLNKNLVRFFQVLRDHPAELVDKVKLTPWARAEYEFCLENPDADDPIETARRLFFRLWMSYSGMYNSAKGSWRRHTHGRRSVILDLKPENLFEASKRFLSVQIENRDAFKLMEEMDAPDALFYLDPPYVFSTRTTSKAYSHEMTNENHRTFAEALRKLSGFVVLSGYPSEIYKELFEDHGWQRIDKEAATMSGSKRTECLWLSPSTSLALSENASAA